VAKLTNLKLIRDQIFTSHFISHQSQTQQQQTNSSWNTTPKPPGDHCAIYSVVMFATKFTVIERLSGGSVPHPISKSLEVRTEPPNTFSKSPGGPDLQGFKDIYFWQCFQHVQLVYPMTLVYVIGVPYTVYSGWMLGWHASGFRFNSWSGLFFLAMSGSPDRISFPIP